MHHRPGFAALVPALALLAVCSAAPHRLLAASEDSTADAAAAPAAPRARRILEPRSGFEFRMDTRWQAQPDSNTEYRLDGKIESGQLQLRFPLNYQDPPASIAAARELDLEALREQPDRFPKGIKEVDNPRDGLLANEGVTLAQYTSRYSDGRQRYITRQYYVSNSDAKVVAVRCTLPETAVAPGDACVTLMKSAALIPARERADRLALIEKQAQKDPDADNFTISCITVNEEVSEWRSSNPAARLNQMPRFASLYAQLLVKAYIGANTRAIAAATQNADAYIERVAATCSARPESTYGDALESAR